MKQLLQSLRNGSTKVANVPLPMSRSGQNLIQTSVTLVSAGTERMLLDFGRSNFIKKATSQPDKVKQVLEKVKTDGIASTFEAVNTKLDEPLPLGYCNVGRVVETNVEGFMIGDRVVSNGKHAQVVSVPKNLCALIPDKVTDEQAAFTVLASIGLQGIRLVGPTLGERIVVTGMGVIGLLVVQMLRAQGCQVLAIDFDENRLALAKKFGAEIVNRSVGEEPVSKALRFSKGDGVDAVIITAATQSNEPVSQAAMMCRKRGRIVLVGVAGLNLNRADFYHKELTFQVSCSYGPGRYDDNYEELGQDYPLGFVRWTVQRNFEAVLEMMASGVLRVDDLISHRFHIDRGDEAIQLLSATEASLGILLNYPSVENLTADRRIDIKFDEVERPSVEKPVVAFMGAGNYAGRVLMPSFKKEGALLRSVISSGGVSALHYGKKFGFEVAGTDTSIVYNDPSVDLVVVATRHNKHAEQVISALEAGKHVFCEKPLCLTLHELETIESLIRKNNNLQLAVGFNRRFSPQVKKMVELLRPVSEPKVMVFTINAGNIPKDHWTQKTDIGGGRIVGECCHFIDLARHLVGASISTYDVQTIGRAPELLSSDDKVSITLKFEDGSIVTIHYLANGHRGFPKERVEVFVAGRVLQLDNFRRLKGWGWPNFRSMNLWKQDKGQRACVADYLRSLKSGGYPIIPLSELIEVSRVSIDVGVAARTQ